MEKRFLKILFIFAFLSGCSTTEIDNQVIKHNHLNSKNLSSRQLMVFMDGTGNDIADRTNVRRLFEMTSSLHRPEVITYYDPGVGTGDNYIDRLSGLALGAGFNTNLVEALLFLTENYQENDEIYIFGFSRGAYSAALLASLISGAGLPQFTEQKDESAVVSRKRLIKMVDNFLEEVNIAELKAEKYANNKTVESLTPEARAKSWRKDYWQILNQSDGWTTNQQRERPNIAILGLWDPVNSLIKGSLKSTLYGIGKIAWSVSDISEFERHKGYDYHPYVLSSKIEQCLIALSLDEERQPFVLELPDADLGIPKKYEFVWFTGDHSDVGGGHSGDKDLAGISLNWMLSQVGDKLLGEGGEHIRVYENYLGGRHDLFFEQGWNELAYRVRGEVLGKYSQKIKPLEERKNRWIPEPDAIHVTPLRYEGWTMKIHSSVINRMNSASDLFYIPRTDNQVLDLTKDFLIESDIAKRNPKSKYIPRPFRDIPAVAASDESWANHDWTAEKIMACYPIVSTKNSKLKSIKNKPEDPNNFIFEKCN